MQFESFLAENAQTIAEDWRVGTFNSGKYADCRDALQQHIEEVLGSIAGQLNAGSAGEAPIRRAQSKMAELLDKKNDACGSAGDFHFKGGFDITEVIAEFHALRAGVIQLWRRSAGQSDHALPEIIRLNEAIDQIMIESVACFSKKLNSSKDLFLATLGHDLRTPVSALAMSANLLSRLGPLNDRQLSVLALMRESGARIDQMVEDLIELNRLHLSDGIPIRRCPMDMGGTVKQLIEEARICHGHRVFSFSGAGNLKGNWDKARVSQLFSNLISNAVQYASPESPIGIDVRGDETEVAVSLHNQGTPIAPEDQDRIFGALVRISRNASRNLGEAANLGLGLYIAQQIVVSHGGTIDVTSSVEQGTTFAAHFPRCSGAEGLTG